MWISATFPFFFDAKTFSCVPGSNKLSFSFAKNVIWEMSIAVLDSIVRKVHSPPHPFMKLRATASSLVQLETPHHVIVLPTLYDSKRFAPIPRYSCMFFLLSLDVASNKSRR